MKRTLLVLSLLAFLAVCSMAQIKKGEELQRLSDFFSGTWTFTGESVWKNGRFPHMSQSTYEMVMDGTWMQWEVYDDYNGRRQIYHRGFITWDAAEGVYIDHHVSSTSTRMLTARGRWIDERTYESDTGDFAWDDGNTYRFRIRYEKTADNVLRFTMHQRKNDEEFSLRLEGEYRRTES